MPKDIYNNLLRSLYRIGCAVVVLCLLINSSSVVQAQSQGDEEDFPTWVLPGFAPEPEPRTDVQYATSFTYTPPVVETPAITVTPAYITDPTPSNPEPEVILETTPEPSTTPSIEPTPEPEPVVENTQPETNENSQSNNFFLPSAPAEDPTPQPVVTTKPKSNIQPSIFGTPKPPSSETSTLNSAPKTTTTQQPSQNTLFARQTPQPAPEPVSVAKNTQPIAQPVVKQEPKPQPTVTAKPKPTVTNTVRVKQYKSPQRTSAGTTTVVFKPKTEFKSFAGALPYDTEKTHLVGDRGIESHIEAFLQSQKPSILTRLAKQLPWILLLVVLALGYQKRRIIYRRGQSLIFGWRQKLRAGMHNFLHWFIDHHLPGFYHERKENPVLFIKRKI